MRPLALYLVVTAALPALVLADLPTFTFGPASNYLNVATANPSPTGGNLRILPTSLADGGIPPQGIDFYFGPDTQASITEALRGVCASGWSQDCASTLTQILDKQYAYKLAARDAGYEQFFYYGAAAAVAGFGVIIGHEQDAARTITAVHIPSSDVVQLQKLSTTPFVVVAPTATASLTLSTVATSTIASGAPSITTLTADQSGHHKGDVVLSIPHDPAMVLMQMIRNEGGYDLCKNTTATNRRRLFARGSGSADYRTIDRFTSSILVRSPRVFIDALIVGLPAVFPVLRDARDAASLRAAEAAAAALNRFQGIDANWVRAIADYIWAGVREVCVNDALSVESIVYEEWMLENKCPTDAKKRPACDSANCAGKSEGRCTLGDNAGCLCLMPGTVSVYNTEPRHWDDAQQVIASVFGEESGGDVLNSPQQIAWASYINPIADPGAWNRLINYPSARFTTLIANVLNGPDDVVNPQWKDVIDRALAMDKKMIAYVRTGYLGVSQQQFATRLGSRELGDWVAQIEQDVEKWYELYGERISGIFFDEGWPECGPDNIYAKTYRCINDNTKRKHPGAFTVLNPGSPMAECFEDTMDTLMTFESSYEAYTQQYVPNTWTPRDSRKIWHIIYKVPQDKIESVVQLSKQRGAGLIHITNDIMPNPYDNLDNEAYIQTLINSVEGRSVAVAGPHTYPFGPDGGAGGQFLRVSRAEYTSVSLEWNDAAVGYRVHVNGKLAVELPGWTTKTTIGMLPPGTANIQFTVFAVNSDGNDVRQVGSATASTLALPDQQSIVNLTVANMNSASFEYEADVLVPSAFTRLFLCCPRGKSACRKGGYWPIAYKPGSGTISACHFVVEGDTLFRYNGEYGADLGGIGAPTAATWDWVSLGSISHVVNNYHHKWKIDKTGENQAVFDFAAQFAAYFIVQLQGYTPLTNVWYQANQIEPS